jgi:hypothetical protein
MFFGKIYFQSFEVVLEDPAFSTGAGVGQFSNANNFLFDFLIIEYNTRFNRGQVENLKSVSVIN